MKKFADNKARAKPSNLSEGDKVIVKRDPSHKKSSAPYDPETYIVTQRKGTMITAKREGKEITRNSSFFKKVDPSIPTNAEESDDELALSTPNVAIQWEAQEDFPHISKTMSKDYIGTRDYT